MTLAFDPTFYDRGAEAASEIAAREAEGYAEDNEDLRERLRDGLHIALEAAIKLRAANAALPSTNGKTLDDWAGLVGLLDDWISQDWCGCKAADFKRHFEGDVS